MTNLDFVMAILAKHREARAWDDGAVAADVLAQLGLDAGATVKEAAADTGKGKRTQTDS